MPANDLLYQIALTRIPSIGNVLGRALIEKFEDAHQIFKASKKDLAATEKLGEARAAHIKNFNNFDEVEREMAFIEKQKIKTLFFPDTDYPKRLRNCYDSPILLYYKGTADLNADKIVSVVGTRNNSDYGKQICEQLIQDIAAENVLIISGLAFGIDTIAHKSALKNNLQTIGVVAHGLDRIYPSQNTMLAGQMLQHGGLLTEYGYGTLPDRHNFPGRNRIVAGICDALILVESSEKGGSLITADLANGYNKDVFAFPGRITDSRSEGCNQAIKNNKASMITGSKDLLEMMNWIPKKIQPKKQRELFVQLSEQEHKIYEALKERENVHIDEIYALTHLSSSAAASALLTMEMQNLIASLPGKLYRLV